VSKPSPIAVVRAFSREDEGLVQEWPVALPLEAVRALVPETAADPELREIHAIDHATAEKLVGAPLAADGEPVDFYVEPVAFVTEE
jgi:hypothetical protein